MKKLAHGSTRAGPDETGIAVATAVTDAPVGPASPAKLDDLAQVLIGRHLKAVYSEIVEQPVPDQILKLLEELERKETKR